MIKKTWKYLLPLTILSGLIACIWLLSRWLQSGLNPLQQQALLLGAVIVGVSTAIQGYQALKSITDSWLGKNSANDTDRTEEDVPGQYEKLKNWLTQLPEMEYRDSLRGFLTVKEQQLLRGGVEQIDRGGALGTIQELRKLGEFESYLSGMYPGRFGDGT